MFCVLFAMQSPGRRNHGSCLLLATVGCCVLTPEPAHTSVPVQPLMGTETFVLLLRVQSSSSSSLRGEKVPYRKHSSNNKHSPTLSFFFPLCNSRVVSFIWYWNTNRTTESLWLYFYFGDQGCKVFPSASLGTWTVLTPLVFEGGGGGNGKNLLLEVSGNSLFISDTLQIVPSLCPGVSHCLLTWLTHWCLVELDSYKHSTEIIGKGWGWDTLCTALIRTQEKPLEWTGVSDLW